MRHTQRLAAPLGALLTSWALAACQAKPTTSPKPAAASATSAATRTTATVASSAATTQAGAARPGAPARTRISPAEAERRAQARADSLDRVRHAAMHADSIADAARVAKEQAAAQAAMKTTLLEAISFNSDSSSLRIDATAPLDHKVAILVTNPTVSLRITGHAYEGASEKENIALGLARAESAKKYIVVQGIAANRIQTAGAADQKPAGAADESLGALRSDRFEITSAPPVLQNP